MEIKKPEMNQYVSIEVEKDDLKFSFVMPNGVKVITAYAAAYDSLSKLYEMLKQAHDQAAPQLDDGEKKSECVDAEVV